MKLRLAFVATLLLTLPAMAERPTARQEFCGGEVAPGELTDYFRRLSEHLTSSPDAVPMSFFSESFSIESGGENRTFRRAQIGPGASALPSLEDWREIARRGAPGIHDGGWRGCFLADGKAAFETDAEGRLGLKSYDRDRPWRD